MVHFKVTQSKFKVSKKFIQENREIFKAVMEDLGKEFTAVFNDPNEFPEYPGDIVDTGKLRDSQKMVEVRKDQYQFEWYTPYAGYVFSGYITRRNRRMPGRNWVKAGVRRFDFRKVYREKLKGYKGEK